MIDLTKENAQLKRENQALLNILRAVLDESRWPDLDELIQDETKRIPTTVQ